MIPISKLFGRAELMTLETSEGGGVLYLAVDRQTVGGQISDGRTEFRIIFISAESEMILVATKCNFKVGLSAYQKSRILSLRDSTAYTISPT